MVSWELPEKMYGVPLPFSSDDDAKLRNCLGPPPCGDHHPSSTSPVGNNTPMKSYDVVVRSEDEDIISFGEDKPAHDSEEDLPMRLPKAAPRPRPNLIKTEAWFRSITGCTEEEFSRRPSPFIQFPDGSLGKSTLVP